VCEAMLPPLLRARGRAAGRAAESPSGGGRGLRNSPGSVRTRSTPGALGSDNRSGFRPPAELPYLKDKRIVHLNARLVKASKAALDGKMLAVKGEPQRISNSAVGAMLLFSHGRTGKQGLLPCGVCTVTDVFVARTTQGVNARRTRPLHR